jgi:RNA polymerase sigma-70 factor (ECF subfamily)
MAEDAWPSTHLSLILAVKDEALLLERLKHAELKPKPGDTPAWEEFVARYSPPIEQFCARKLGFRAAAADDVAQEILLKLVKVLKEFEYDPSGSFRKWLRTVAKYAVLNCAEKEGKRLDIAVGGSWRLEDWIKNSPDEVEGLSAILSESLCADLLHEAERLVRNRVDDVTWQVFQFRLQETPAKDVAEQFGMKAAAVHRAFSRVKQMLREEVAMLLNRPKRPAVKNGECDATTPTDL